MPEGLGPEVFACCAFGFQVWRPGSRLSAVTHRFLLDWLGVQPSCQMFFMMSEAEAPPGALKAGNSRRCGDWIGSKFWVIVNNLVKNQFPYPTMLLNAS